MRTFLFLLLTILSTVAAAQIQTINIGASAHSGTADRPREAFDKVNDNFEFVKVREYGLAASDETTGLTTGTAKVTFRIPRSLTVTAVRASLTTAQTTGTIITIDINEGGTSILSTKITIDNTEKTSTTAATAAVISDSALADDAEITIDIDQVGDGTATGLKVWIIGY